MTAHYSDFIRQLDRLIEIHHKNVLIKRSLWWLVIFICSLLSISLAEYYAYFSSNVRLILLISFILLNVICAIYAWILPKKMKREQAAIYLSQQWPESQDKLANVLNLYAQGEKAAFSSDLLYAAIDQKIESFKVYHWARQFRLRIPKKAFRYASAGFLCLILLLFFYPKTIVGAGERVLRFQTYFEKEYPFQIQILNPVLEGIYKEDFFLQLEIAGQEVPLEVFLLIEGKKYSCKKQDLHHFEYEFKSLSKEIEFQIGSLDFLSRPYILKIAPKPIWQSFKAKITPPSYTGLDAYTENGNGNLSIPEGSRLQWTFDVKNADSLIFSFKQEQGEKRLLSLQSKDIFQGNTRFVFEKRMDKKMTYDLLAYHPKALQMDTLSYTIEIIPDAFPQIQVMMMKDSFQITKRYFRAMISDDYACRYLLFVAQVFTKEGLPLSPFIDTLEIRPLMQSQDVTYYFDIATQSLQAGESMEYFFEVYDNDALHGYKKTRSNSFSYYKKSLEEISQEVEKQNQVLQKSLQNTLSKAQNIKTDWEKASRQINEKSQLQWEDKKALEQVIKKQKDFFEQMQELSKQMQSKWENEAQLQEYSPALLEKQKMLEELFKELFDADIQKQLQELEKLLQENVSRETWLEKMAQIKMKQKELEQEITRNSEIFKQLEFERSFDKVLEDFEKLKENLESQEKNLQEQNAKENKDNLQKQQAQIREDAAKLKKDLQKLEQQNQALIEPNGFTNPENKMQAVEETLKQAQENITNDEFSKGAQKDKQAQEELTQMQEAIEQEESEEEDEQEAEDAQSIRLLLKGILQASYKQEKLLDELQSIPANDPRYTDIIRAQSDLRKEILQISDSISAISIRQPAVAVYTQKEVKQLLMYSRNVLSSLLQMNSILYQRSSMMNRQALGDQQYVMTSLNNLSLLLSESLDRMEMKKKGGSGKGKKSKKPQDSPGNKSGKKPSAKDMQEALNKQIEALKKRIDENKGKEPSQRNTQGLSESFARAAAQQEMIRRLLQGQYKEMMSEDPKTAAELNRLMGEMEKTETDLVNKMVNTNTLSRQENIQTRLLEAEKADLKREQEMRRESKEGSQIEKRSPSVQEFLKQKNAFSRDMLHLDIPHLKPYYREKTQRYMKP